MEQVPPSVDKTQKEEVMVQLIVTSSDRHTEVQEGRGGTNLRSPTIKDRTQKPQVNADLEDQITKMAIETFQGEGFRLLNSSIVPKYISHNGKSAMDIALIRGPIKGEN